jgi:hypothetical protein
VAELSRFCNCLFLCLWLCAVASSLFFHAFCCLFICFYDLKNNIQGLRCRMSVIDNKNMVETRVIKVQYCMDKLLFLGLTSVSWIWRVENRQ